MSVCASCSILHLVLPICMGHCVTVVAFLVPSSIELHSAIYDLIIDRVTTYGAVFVRFGTGLSRICSYAGCFVHSSPIALLVTLVGEDGTEDAEMGVAALIHLSVTPAVLVSNIRGVGLAESSTRRWLKQRAVSDSACAGSRRLRAGAAGAGEQRARKERGRRLPNMGHATRLGSCEGCYLVFPYALE